MDKRVLEVCVGLSGEEVLDGAFVFLEEGRVKGRLAVTVADVDVDALGDDQVDNLLPLFERLVVDLDADEVVHDARLLDVGEVDLDGL